MASGTHVQIDGVGKRYGGVAALAGLDLELGPGITGLLGPNGAGKTTLIRILATLLAPAPVKSGSTAGGPPTRLTGSRSGWLGYLPQDLGLYPRFTVFEFVDYLAILKELDDPADRHRRVRSALEAVELEDLAGRRSAPCRAGCGVGSGSPRRSWPTRSCCCWTSRPPAWIPSSGCGSASCSPAGRAPRTWCSRPIWWRMWPRSAPGWWCCGRAGPGSAAPRRAAPAGRRSGVELGGGGPGRCLLADRDRRLPGRRAAAVTRRHPAAGDRRGRLPAGDRPFPPGRGMKAVAGIEASHLARSPLLWLGFGLALTLVETAEGPVLTGRPARLPYRLLAQRRDAAGRGLAGAARPDQRRRRPGRGDADRLAAGGSPAGRHRGGGHRRVRGRVRHRSWPSRPSAAAAAP